MSDTDNAKEMFQKAMHDFMSQNYESSIESFTRAIDADPELKLAILSRGSAYFKLDRIEEARRDFDTVVKIDPNSARAFHLRGLVHDKAGDQRAALADFDKAVALDPAYGAAYYSRANLHAKMGSTDLATEDIQMATHLTEVNIEQFANENNIWRSQQLRVEEMGGADPMVR